MHFGDDAKRFDKEKQRRGGGWGDLHVTLHYLNAWNSLKQKNSNPKD